MFLRQSTASQEVILGRFVDSTDGNTEKTALTIANTDIKVWKSGAATLANKNSGGGIHIANGVYYAVLDATDTDTLGPLELHVHASGALYVQKLCHVLAAAIYDQVFGTSALSTLDAAAVRSAIGLASANIDTQLGAIAGYIDTEVAAIKAKTDNLPAAPAAVSDIPTASTVAAAVWAVVIDGTNSAIALMRGFAAVLLGKASGLGTATAVYRNIGDTRDVVQATVDSDGNRTAVTTDLT